LINGLRDEPLDIRRLGDIHGEKACLAAPLFNVSDSFFTAGNIEISDDDARTFSRKREGCRSPDAGCAACDEGVLPFT